jgi:hypothetical protein
MTMTIEVTEQDILDGCSRSTQNCPIARASKRAGLGPLVFVNGFSIKTYGARGVKPIARYALPQEACDFVVDYDAGEPVLPFSFEIDLKAGY